LDQRGATEDAGAKTTTHYDAASRSNYPAGVPHTPDGGSSPNMAEGQVNVKAAAAQPLRSSAGDAFTYGQSVEQSTD